MPRQISVSLGIIQSIFAASGADGGQTDFAYKVSVYERKTNPAGRFSAPKRSASCRLISAKKPFDMPTLLFDRFRLSILAVSSRVAFNSTAPRIVNDISILRSSSEIVVVESQPNDSVGTLTCTDSFAQKARG